MTKQQKRGLFVVLFVVALLVIDQVVKILVKTNMPLHDNKEVTSWFYISFIENNGMAYGLSFIPKYALSIFRMVACGALCWYLYKKIKGEVRMVWLILVALILAGAAGNLIDCMFYGLIFSESTPIAVSHLVSFGDGYQSFLQGRVVDMFYFPLFNVDLPEWLPIWGGQKFVFFNAIFNMADSYITCGVIAMFLFCRKELRDISWSKTSEEKKDTDASIDPMASSEVIISIESTQTDTANDSKELNE